MMVVKEQVPDSVGYDEPENEFNDSIANTTYDPPTNMEPVVTRETSFVDWGDDGSARTKSTATTGKVRIDDFWRLVSS